MARRRSTKSNLKKRNRLRVGEGRRLHHETLEQRQLLAALLGVSPNSGELINTDGSTVLNTSPTELTIRFDGSQQIDADTLDGIRLIRSGGDGEFGPNSPADDVIIQPGHVGFADADEAQGEQGRIVTMRFADPLPDDLYQLEIYAFDDASAGITGLRSDDGEFFEPFDPDADREIIPFELELGGQVLSVVPQPISVNASGDRVQHRNQIHVFFNEDPLSDPAAGVIDTNTSSRSVVRPEFYNLFFTNDTVENTDDAVFTPTNVEYDPELHRAVLTFDSDLADFAPEEFGTFRLRIGSSQSLPAPPAVVNADLADDVDGTFDGAFDLGTSFGGAAASIVIRGEVEPTVNSTVRWPGVDSPGTRDNRRDPQLTGQPDTTDGINVYYYNFAPVYGTDPFDNVLENVITDAQKQRTREVLSLYAEHLGVQFIETEDRGLQIVTGDLRTLVETARTGEGEPLHEFRLNDEDPTQGVLVMDAGERWYDGYGLSPDARPSWFAEALRGIGSLLGIGHTFDQVPGVASGSNPALYNASMFRLPDGSLPSDFSIEPDFLSSSDIIPGQALHRPETRDVELYRFSVAEPGRISIETFAERLEETSLLDTDLKLWRLNASNGRYELVARNNDFFSNDSFLEVDVTPDSGGAPAQYVVGITASGNEDYNPLISGSGSGGRTEGRYEMRVTFQDKNVETILDGQGTPLDGDGDGSAGGDFNFWFRTAKPHGTAAAGAPRTLFVSKSGANNPTAGSLNVPFRTIDFAFAQAKPGDVVRILPDAGADGRINTVEDNSAYEIGRGGPSNAILSDGETFNVPQGVTVMIDAGTLLKLRNAKISVGSERVDEDRSLAALQVLGAPILVEADGSVVRNADGTVDRTSGQVIFTSYQDESIGIDTNPLQTTPASGQWGGIEFRNDFDLSEGRPSWETEGVFIDYVSHANLRYGGGRTSATRPVVNPLQMLEARPTLIYNTIRFSGDAAMSADPNSFQETNFHAPLFQRVDSFTSDYQRVGPDIRGNTLTNNSINGLFVRVSTPALGERTPMMVSGRFDDRDITHVISEVLVLQGQSGGAELLEQRPDVLNVSIDAPISPSGQGTLPVGETFDYRITFITARGRESLASLPTRSATVSNAGSLRLTGLPQAPTEYAGRRLYRLDPDTGDYVFVQQLDRNTTGFLDVGQTRGGLLSDAAIAAGTNERLFPRFDARLSIDPGLVIKLDTARIEARFGADFYAEGQDGQPIVFTSRRDDTYGAGGTFDTNNDGSASTAQPADWSGLVFRQESTASLDHTIVRYAGGNSTVSGGSVDFNPVEILQADVRVANSLFENNASGNPGMLDFRDGIGFNGEATIFVRGAQPVIINNVIRDNLGAAISVNPDALNYLEVQDRGRSTGIVGRFTGKRDNQGLLVAGNKLDNNSVNGMLVRNEALTTESVWDDTDIVHVVERFVYAWNHHHRSGLRLKSGPDEGLVVKLQDGGALVADRYLNDVEDSIGGTIQVLGQPGFPVVLTSIHDDTVGAGFTQGGLPQTDTDNVSITAMPGDWHGIVVRAGANDRNVPYVLETEAAIPAAAGRNAIPSIAQGVGSLATNESSADENRRLGFNIRGTLSQNSDIDVYSFTANGQTEVYLDVDDTNFGLDSVVELIDANGNILAQSNDSSAESTEPGQLVNNMAAGRVLPLFKTGQRVIEGPNPLDAGMRVILPGNSNTENRYFVRVRSSNLGPGDAGSQLSDPAAVVLGQSRGQYQLSIRLRETDEIAGTTVRLADIRYATDAIDIPASPFDSPLAAESAERLNANGLDLDTGTSFTNGGALDFGAVNESHRRVLRVSGTLGNNSANFESIAAGQDIDVFRVEMTEDFQEPNIIGENRFVSAVFDIDYADQLGRANSRLSIFDSSGRLILHGLDSNVADDQGRPRQGSDMENLEGGSVGKLDSYIGPVELQVGTYYVVVSSAQMTPQVLDQYFENDPTDTNIRMLPISSVRRIAEEGFNDGTFFTNQDFNTTADLPNIVPLFDDTSIVPYALEDVRMFVTLQGGLTGSNQTTVVSVDPFTGQLERTIGQFGQPVRDLGMRRDGELFSFSVGPQTGGINPGNTGNYLNISPSDASANNFGDDGLTFRRNNEDQNNTENDPNAVFRVNAMAFVPQSSFAGASIGNVPSISDGERLIVVGDRNNSGRGFEVHPDFRENIVYSMVANNGAATNRGSTNGNLDRNFDGDFTIDDRYGPASNKIELGVLDVGQFIDSDPEKTGGSVTGIAQNQNLPGFSFSTMFGVTDEGGLYSFDTFDRRTVDVNEDGPPDYFSVINTTFHGTIERDPLHSDFFGNPPEFSSVTLGPRATESGRYENVFFATTTDGWVYTFQINASGDVEPAPVLVNGRSAVPVLGAFGNSVLSGREVTGVAFSIREENPWHETGDRNTPFVVDGPNSSNNLHGVFQPHDQSRRRISGGSSLYFGFEPTGDVADNTLNNDAATGNLAPGGVHGTTISRPFSLEGVSPADKPTVYFNYFLETQDDSDYTLTRQQLDSFRVFAAGDDGQWQLVSTSNSFRSFVNLDEYDYFANTDAPVQELHQNSDVWRQARVDLSPLAGNKNVQLRFDFSTAGGMQSQFRLSGYLTEIQAVPGTEIVDGSTFRLEESLAIPSANPTTTFEFVRGTSANIIHGALIPDGQRVTLEQADGTVITLTLTLDPPTGPNEVQFDRSQSGEVIAANLVSAFTAIDPTLIIEADQARLTASESNDIRLHPERFDLETLTSFEVPPGAVIPNGQFVAFSPNTGSFTFVQLTLGTPSGSSQVQFRPGETGAEIAVNIAAALNARNPAIEAIADGTAVRVFADGQFSLFPADFSSSTITSINMPDGSEIPDGQQIVVERSSGAPLVVTLTTDPAATFPDEVLYDTSDSGADIATAVRDALIDLNANDPDPDPFFSVSTSGVRLQLSGGSEFVFDGSVFGLEAPAVLTVPPGSVIPDGQELTLQLRQGAPITLTLVQGFPGFRDVQYSTSDSAADIASKIAAELSAIDPSLTVTTNGSDVIVDEGSEWLQSPDRFGQAVSSREALPNGNVPIFYQRGMSAEEVRDSIRESLAAGLGERDSQTGLSKATAENFPAYGTNRIRVFEQSLFANNSAVGFSTFLPGDEFGSFGSTQVSNSSSFGNLTRHGGLNNDVEGVYIDDIVVGFASRGEVVLNAPADNRNFEIDPTYRAVRTDDTHQPEFPNEILVGGYTLETRAGAEYGVPDDYDPIRLELNEQDGLGRSFDVNDRLNPGAVTLIAPAGRDLQDGDTFVVSNGSQSLTFEFDSDGSVASGNVRVPFVPVMTGSSFNRLTDESAEVARAIRDAINSSQARNVLGITAAGGDSRAIGAMTGNRVELFAAKNDHRIRINPSSGRFLLVDMVDAETPYGRESARTLPLVDQDTETATRGIFFDTFARAVVTDYTNGQTDTLVATGKIGDRVGTGFGNEVLRTNPSSDIDILKIFLNEGDSIDVDLDTVGWNRGNEFASPELEIYRDGATPTLVRTSSFTSSTAPGETNPGAWISGFTASEDGNYFVVVRSDFTASFDNDYGEYQLTIRPAGHVVRDVLMTDYHMDRGDRNVSRSQGQLIIESNFISDFAGTGIRATYSGDRLPQPAPTSPLERQPGGVALLRNENTDRLLPGTVITNNVVYSGGGTGILFAGLDASSGVPAPPVPFGRIVNNTVVGSGSATGIEIANASPTVLNNVIVDFGTGLNIGAGAGSTEANFNVFQGNGTPANRPLGRQSIVVPANESLFQDPGRNIFIPASGAPLIDSSLSQLNDRGTFVDTVKQPMGISSSPILAPEFDAFGIPRVADATGNTSGGVGSNVFVDRGAIDRADFVQPVAVLITPTDFIGGQGVQNPDGDIDPSASFVRLPEDSDPVEFFEIQLLDPAGTGPDASTVTEDTVTLTRDGVPLVPGVDYTFGYNDNNRLIRLTPLAGIWAPKAAYEITLNNRDRRSIAAPDARAIADGDQWTVTDSRGMAATFEFETGYVLEVPQASGGEVDGVVDGVITYRRANGDQFRVELDSDGDLAAPAADVVISYDNTTVAADLAASLADAFADSPLGLTNARPLENGLLSIGGAPGDVLDVQTTGLNLSGTPGVTGPLRLSLPAGAVADSYEGETLTVSDGTKSVTYEFTLDDETQSGTTAIMLQSGEDAAAVANRLAQAIDDDFSTLSPEIQNGTSLVLNEPVGSAVDVSDTQISISGVAGGAIPIAVLPSIAFNQDLVAAQLLAAISATPLRSTPFLAGGGTLLLDDTASVVNQDGDRLDAAVVGIKDLAGNDLLPNRANEETQFTVLMPGVELDFGDAPADETPLAYEKGADGILNPARHTLTDRRLPRLGELVDSDFGNPFPESDDGDDGVLIGAFEATPGIFLDPDGGFLGFLNPLDSFGTELAVDISGSGLLDAWVDFNQDGDWNDPGEQVFANVAVLPGENRLRIQTPSNAFDGETWARFRLSPTGNQAPQGVVIGGEVEDYLVTVASVQLPQPIDDDYDVDEDAAGGLTVSSASGVLFNPTTGDTLFGLLNPQAALENDVRSGTLDLAADGSFTYTPNAEFYGTDTFTYRILGQQRVDINDPSSPLLPVRSSEVGTVTITVNPVNDAPLVVDRSFTTLEDIDGGLRITAAELLAGAAAGDFDASIRAPFDESAQTLRITGINENPNDLNALADPPALRPDGEVEFTTTQGMLVRANFVDGALVDLLYFPTDHYNADNPKAANDPFDSFTITLYDDGVTVFDDLAGTELDPPLRPAFSIGTITLDVTPVNDEPIIPVTGPNAVEQEINVLEDSAPYAQPWTPVLPGPAGAGDENDQTVNYSLMVVSGDAGRIFAAQPTIDSNGQLSFDLAANQNGTVVFEVTPRDDGSDGTANGDDAVGDPVLLTISVAAVNDAPIFTPTPSTTDSNGNVQSVIEVLEQDDESNGVVIDWASSVQTGPTSATDELLSQDVTFNIAPAAGNPGGLFAVAPSVNSQGVLTFTPAADAVGTAVFVVTARDDGNSDPALPEDENTSTPVTLTIHVRPVNDAPRLDPAVLGTAESLNSDDAWSVAANGNITFRLREDNTQQNVGPQLYRIDLVRQGNPSLYGRIGLLDVFDAGPANEEDGTLGGSQNLELLNFDLRTNLGGDIFLDVDENNNPILLYDPPDDVNRLFSGQDSFSYTVTDDGDTWRLGAGLGDDPLTATNTVFFTLEPVNDAPQFTLTQNRVAAFEDAEQLRFDDFASNVFAGPPATALDETDLVSGQSVSFSVTARNPADEALAAALFSKEPRISPDGTLRFTPAPDQYGTIVFDVVLTDDGPDNDIRGDVVSSAAQPLTITIQPQNDAPRFANNGPVVFSLDEDNAFLIPLRAMPGEPQGLLDKFTVGPANEAADIIPGGNQTLALAEPVPASTPAGGQLTRLTIDGTEYLRYVPKAHFNGVDSFVYSVTDVNAVSVDLAGNVTADPRKAFFTVDLNVRAINDAPQFGGAPDVEVPEDAGENQPDVDPSDVGLTVIPDWATNIQAGPAGAVDENAAPPEGQFVEFTVVPDDPAVAAELFSSTTDGLQVTVDPDGTLRFRTRPDANGSAGFTVFATDNGNADPARPGEVNTSTTRSFTITVTPVNDPPSFTPGAAVTVNEDSGSYNQPWARDILPGPADEQVDQTVRFEVEVDAADLPLFQTPPQITENGNLRFTPALNAHGTVQVGVRAIDSEGGIAATETLTITIVPQPDSPVAEDDAFGVDEDTVLVIDKADVLSNDADPDLPDDALTIVLDSNTTLSGATVTLDANNNIVYDPSTSSSLQALAPQDSLTDTFAYSLVDSTGRSSETAVISVVVSGVNDVPQVAADDFDVQPNEARILRPLDNDVDVDGTIDPSSLEITLQPAFGSVSVLPNGTIRYTPFSGFRGSDMLRYTVADNLGGVSQEGTITITSNESPVANNDSAAGFRDEPIDIQVLSNDNDPDGTLDPTSVVITRAPTRGEVVVLSNGTVRYVPNSGFFGTDSFAYTVADNEGRRSNVGEVSVRLAASRLQNPIERADVNNDGNISPIDALLVINYLNSGRPTEVPADAQGPPYVDVDGNRRIEPLDALGVINALNRLSRTGSPSGGEGESEATVSVAEAVPQVEAKALVERTVVEDAVSNPQADSVDKLVGSGEVRIERSSSHDDVFDLIARGQLEEDADKRTDSVDDLWRRFDRIE